NQLRLRPSRAVERYRCLVPGIRLRTAALFRFRRILAYRHRRGPGAWVHSTGELRASLSIHYSVNLLDALAHVAILLDSRLRFPPAGSSPPRDVVEKSCFSGFDDPVRIVAQSKRALRALGLLSRGAARLASSGTTGAAQVRLDAF